MRGPNARRLILSKNYMNQFPCDKYELGDRILKALGTACIPVSKVEDKALKIHAHINRKKALKLEKIALRRGISISKVLIDYFLYFPIPDGLNDDDEYKKQDEDTKIMCFYMPTSLWASTFRYARNNKLITYAIDHMRLPRYDIGKQHYHFYYDLPSSLWNFLIYCSKLRGYNYPSVYLRQLLYEDKIKSQFHNILTQGIAYYPLTNENR